MNATTQNKYHLLACASLIALVLLDILWETVLAPLRPGGSWMVLKVIPLLWIMRGVIRRDNFTMQWSSMLILLYFAEGVIRGSSDRAWLSAMLGWAEAALSVLFFISTLFYLRPLKKAAKLAAKTAQKTEDK
ncbi:DUF2069 domain-containing protein [Undibacterium sp.]|uniref:DUF2069 domain-containing protein n=1 Tax=Undibacterium sp. TaxID=1914977 RepID=UPI002C986430|nr:DUF2069 domain-containing protein [Undibacterium sp.]HTD02784.1 DUF2069 domain-containing protein [Undibacterium sp.]